MIYKNVVFTVFRYPHLPCLLAGKKKEYYLPMEVCTVVPCERRLLSEEQIENLIRSTARPATERQMDTQYWVCFNFSPKFILLRSTRTFFISNFQIMQLRTTS